MRAIRVLGAPLLVGIAVMAMPSSGTGAMPTLRRLRLLPHEVAGSVVPGWVQIAVPHTWQTEVSPAGRETLEYRVRLTSSCSAWGALSVTAEEGTERPQGRLHRQIAGLAEPGIPMPVPVRILGDGALKRQEGAWLLAEPPARLKVWKLYGEALLRLGHHAWASLTESFELKGGCPASIPHKAEEVPHLSQVLQSVEVLASSKPR